MLPRFKAATLKKISGTITVNSSKIAEERKVGAGDIISAIGKDSSVQIVFEDGSQSLLRNGQIIINEEIGEEKTLLSLVRGIYFSQKQKNKSTLEIKTKNAVLGVRGTKFYVDESPKETYLCVCEGAVEIKNSRSTVVVEKNEDAHVKANAAFDKTKANGMMLDMAWEGFEKMGFKRE